MTEVRTQSAIADFEANGNSKTVDLNIETKLEKTVAQKDEDILFKGVEAPQIADQSSLADLTQSPDPSKSLRVHNPDQPKILKGILKKREVKKLEK